MEQKTINIYYSKNNKKTIGSILNDSKNTKIVPLDYTDLSDTDVILLTKEKNLTLNENTIVMLIDDMIIAFNDKDIMNSVNMIKYMIKQGE